MSAHKVPVNNLSEIFSNDRLQHGPAGAILRAAEQQPWLEGQSYLEAAKRELGRARREAEDIAAAERARGYAEGWARGSKDVFDLVAQTKAAVDQYYAQLETNLGRLVMEIIAEVVDGLDKSEAIALAMKKALKTTELPAGAALLVSPGVLSGVTERLQGLLGSIENSTIMIEAEGSLAEDECRLVSDFCTIDLSLKRQLDLLAESLCSVKIGIKT
jgi:flagellar biosynthesis/type III secretory pathway protein FliH